MQLSARGRGVLSGYRNDSYGLFCYFAGVVNFVLDVANCVDYSVSIFVIMVYLVDAGVLPTSLAIPASGNF